MSGSNSLPGNTYDMGGSEHQLRRIFDSMQNAYFFTTFSGEIKWVNPAALKIFAYDSLDEFLSMNVAELYADPKDRDAFLAELREKKRVRGVELKMLRNDRRYRKPMPTVVNGRRQAPIESDAAKSIVQRAPSTHTSRDAPRQRRMSGNRLESQLSGSVQVPLEWSASTSVQRE